MKLRLLDSNEAEDYKNIIDGYHPSAQTVYDFARSKFSVIAGPTGAGKDTVRNALCLASNQFINILSTTSRPMRPGEQDGVEYHFRELEFFEQGFDERSFLQAALVHKQQISCLDISEIHKLNDSQVGISILVVQTEDQLRALNSNLKTIFIVPPSMTVLLERMNAGRNIEPDELARRVEAAIVELQFALRHVDYYCVINDNLGETITRCQAFLLEGTRDQEHDLNARATIGVVLAEMLRS